MKLSPLILNYEKHVNELQFQFIGLLGGCQMNRDMRPTFCLVKLEGILIMMKIKYLDSLLLALKRGIVENEY